MPLYSHYTTITSDRYANTTTPTFSYCATAMEAAQSESESLNYHFFDSFTKIGQECGANFKEYVGALNDWLKSFVLSESEQDDICFSKKTMEEVL